MFPASVMYFKHLSRPRQPRRYHGYYAGCYFVVISGHPHELAHSSVGRPAAEFSKTRQVHDETREEVSSELLPMTYTPF